MLAERQVAVSGGQEVVEHNYDSVRDIGAKHVDATHGRISAKRPLPVVAAAG